MRDLVDAMTKGACDLAEHARRSVHEVDPEHLRTAAEMLGAAGDMNRLKLLIFLRSEPSDVAALAGLLGRRTAFVSQHLAVLRRANLVRGDRRGMRVVYSLVDHHAELLVDAALAFAVTRER